MCQESSLIFRTGTKIPSQGTKKKKINTQTIVHSKRAVDFSAISHKQLFLHRAVHPVLWECYYISI